MRQTSLSTRILPLEFDWTGTCCCPTGLMNPTLEYRFWSPERRARETDVLPMCCLVAATKMGLGLGVLLLLLLSLDGSEFVENGSDDDFGGDELEETEASFSL